MKQWKGFVCGAVTVLTVLFLTFSVYAMVGEQSITAVFGDIKILLNGTPMELKDAAGNAVEPFIYEGTTYVPIRAVSENLGKEVQWDEETRTAYINDLLVQVAKIQLRGSYSTDDFIIRLHSDRRLIITALESSFDVLRDQEVVLLSSAQYNELYQIIEGLSKEEIDKSRVEETYPQLAYEIVLDFDGKVTTHGEILSFDATPEYPDGYSDQSEMSNKLLDKLNELSPIPIVFTRAPY